MERSLIQGVSTVHVENMVVRLKQSAVSAYSLKQVSIRRFTVFSWTGPDKLEGAKHNNVNKLAAIRRRNHVLWFCEDHLYIFGGLGLLANPTKYGMGAYITHGDVWRLSFREDKVQNTWEFVECFGLLPCPRDDFGHCGEFAAEWTGFDSL
jgi:hypothetical protein